MKIDKIAILGCGNMGGAIAESLKESSISLSLTAASRETLDKMSEILPEAECLLSNKEAVKGADMVIIAVKPYTFPIVADEIRKSLKPGAIIVSIVAGITLDDMSEYFECSDKDHPFFRVIPNTAIRLKKSVTFMASGACVPSNIVDAVGEIFDYSGRTFLILEKDMAACTALASCGIAFFMRFIRAAVEGSVENGLSPSFATEVAAYTAIGAGALLAEGGHPEAEIDKVTTPGGITIRGLNAMESKGFTPAVIAGIKSCI